MDRRSFLKLSGKAVVAFTAVPVLASNQEMFYGQTYNQPLVIIADVTAESTTATPGPAYRNAGSELYIKAVGEGSNVLHVNVDGDYDLHAGESVCFHSNGREWEVM